MDHVFSEALVFIGASLVFVPLFHRLGFGSVLGYLVAGMVVGPFGLGFLSDVESALHVAELGVVLLLFVIGLEMKPSHLWDMRKRLLGLGGLQILLTSVLLFIAGIAFGLSAITSGVLAFALSLSSTAYALQTLIDKNNLSTEFGRASFSILLMQDLVAIPALAIIPSLGVAVGGTKPVMIHFFPVFIILLFIVNKFMLRPAFRWLAATRSREIFTTAALFIVLGVAAITLELGLSAALGTFMAGVLLADSEYRHELEANLEPFKSVLMGLFFIAVGMTVNLSLIAQNPFLIFGGTMLYLLVKGAVIYGTTRMLKLSHVSSKLTALTIAQGGEFAFVIFGIALSTKIAEANIINLLTVMITLSMAINPLILLVEEKLASRKKQVSVEPKYDTIENEAPRVIIAGFGRFGQMFGRILRLQKIPFVAIDHDADQIELLRKFGNKVYYGDILRLDLLESAGIRNSKYFVMAIDDVEISLKATKLIRTHYPDIQIFARARNRDHVFSYMDMGVDYIKRETFDSSINFAQELLLEMGLPKENVHHVIERFREHDHIMLTEQHKLRGDETQYLTATKRASAQLKQVLEDETNKTYIGNRPN